MKIHSDGFKQQIKLMGKEIDSIITIGNTVLGKNELNAVTPSFQGAILKSVMKQLDVDSNVFIPVGTILNYQFGLKVNGEYEYLDFGNYVVYSVEKQEDTNSYKIICYDKMLFTMRDYENLPIAYPITVRNYINSICLVCGLEFKNINDEFANYDREIKKELYLDTNGGSLGYTFRDVLDELAQVTASVICINENDELEVRYPNDTEDTIDEEYLKNVNVNFGEKFGAINTIVLSRSANSDNVYYPQELSENPIEFKISDNQIMNGNDRADYLPDIYEKLNGLEFYINDFSSTGITYYDLYDMYNVRIGENTYKCLMLNDEILITQGLEENVFTELPEESETEYKHASNDDRKINQAYIIAKKNEGKIELFTSQISNIKDDLNNVYTIEQTNQLIQNAETGLTNIFRQSGGNNLLKNTAPFVVSFDEAEYWEGKVKQLSESKSVSGYALGLLNNNCYQTVEIPNGTYSISFRWKKLIPASESLVRYNGKSIELIGEEGEVHTSGEVTTGTLTFEMISNTDLGHEIYDLILKHGNEGESGVMQWQQNANEMQSDTITIGKGLTASSSASNVITEVDNEGIKVKNKSIGTVVSSLTDNGINTNYLKVSGNSNISGLIIQKHGNQVWISGEE